MRKRRTQSLYSSVKHYSKQHCPEDICCNPCCSCVERLQKANKIFADKNQTLARQKEEFLKEIMRLNKNIKGWQKRQRQFKDLQEVKRRLREEIKAELEDKRRVDDMIIKQKLASNKKEKQMLQRQKEQLFGNLEEFQKKFQRVTKEYLSLEDKFKALQKELEWKKQQISKNEDNIANLKKRNSDLQAAVKSKTQIIGQLEKGLNISEQNYLLQKVKNTDRQLQIMLSKQEINSATKSIETLKKETEQKNLSIQQLSAEKVKLDKLVRNLDSTINSYTVLQGQLRNRIFVSEEYALQKQIENKHLESDFYDVLYRKSL